MGKQRDEETVPRDFPWEFTLGMWGRKRRIPKEFGGESWKKGKTNKEKSPKFLPKINPINSKFLIKINEEKSQKLRIPGKINKGKNPGILFKFLVKSNSMNSKFLEK